MHAFVIGLREGLEACTIAVILATHLDRHRAEAARRYWCSCAAFGLGAITLGMIAFNLLHGMQGHTAMAVTEVATATVAVVMLSLVMRWTARQMWVAASTPNRLLVPLACTAVTREAIESALFLTSADVHDQRRATVLLLLGVFAAVALSAIVFFGLIPRASRQRVLVVSQAALGLISAGLVMSIVSTMHDAGWIAFGQDPMVTFEWLEHPRAGVLRTLAAVIGVHPSHSVLEAVAWLIYVALAVVLLVRHWRASVVVRWRNAHP